MQETYNLFGRIDHLGADVSYGHYVTYVVRNKVWFLVDDALVSEVAIDEVTSGAPYLVAYRKQKRNPESPIPISATFLLGMETGENRLDKKLKTEFSITNAGKNHLTLPNLT